MYNNMGKFQLYICIARLAVNCMQCILSKFKVFTKLHGSVPYLPINHPPSIQNILHNKVTHHHPISSPYWCLVVYCCWLPKLMMSSAVIWHLAACPAFADAYTTYVFPSVSSLKLPPTPTQTPAVAKWWRLIGVDTKHETQPKKCILVFGADCDEDLYLSYKLMLYMFLVSYYFKTNLPANRFAALHDFRINWWISMRCLQVSTTILHIFIFP